MNKKIIIIMIIMMLICGCENTKNTPTGIVENYLSKYQMLDKEVTSKLKRMLDEEDLSEEQKEKYEDIFVRQYQNLSYKIKNEEVYGNTAIVDVEIEVLDYHQIIEKTKNEIDDKEKEDKNEIIELITENLRDAKDKNKYEITFNLTKNEDIWTLDEISKIDKEKIHGIY